jgi:hypothetical protein
MRNADDRGRYLSRFIGSRSPIVWDSGVAGRPEDAVSIWVHRFLLETAAGSGPSGEERVASPFRGRRLASGYANPSATSPASPRFSTSR